jgi:hypothetical protein
VAESAPVGVEVAQADYTRAVRGEPIVPGGPGFFLEPLVGGISSSARAAVRRIHKEGVAGARAYLSAKLARHLLAGGGAGSTASSYKASFERYVEWDKAAEAGEAQFDVSLVVPFPCGNAIRAIAHILPDTGGFARVLMWDELPVQNTAAAAMIALPVFAAADSVLGAGQTTSVDVWQLAHGQQQNVSRAAAEATHSEADALLSKF